MATPVAIGVNSVAPTLAGKGTGAYTVDPNAARSKPDKGFAALTRAQYQYYLDKGRPQEKLALGDIKDPKLGARLADRAEMGVIKTFRDMAGTEQRSVSPFGVKLGVDERRVVNRRMGLDKALTTVAARNTAMNGTEDMQLAAAGDALNIGQGLAGQAAQGLSTAANSAYAVRNANKQASANRVSSALSSAASMGAAGWMLGAEAGMTGGGPAGAAIGAGVGLLMSFI